MYDTIVIGMGVSGTMAATTLVRAGRKVLVLEAQDRIGGRVNTVPFGDGVVELGAEWVHGEKPSDVYDLAMKYNIGLVSQDITMDVFHSDGCKGDKEIINDLIMFSLSAIDDPPKEEQPLGLFITSRLKEYMSQKYPELLKDEDFFTELLAFLDLVVDNYEATSNWNDVTTESNYTELEGDQHLSWHRYGYKTLFDIMLNTHNNGPGLPNLEYKLNTEVTRVEWPQEPASRVTVTCKDGQKYTADTVIMTVSLGVLKRRHESLFLPKLPEQKVHAIQSIAMGVMDKVIFLFPYAWWPKSHTFFGFLWRKNEKNRIPKEYIWMTKIFGASTPFGCNKALTLWASGDTAKMIESLPEDIVQTKCMELLRMFMGAHTTIPEPTNILRSQWHQNPFTAGSYSFDQKVDASLGACAAKCRAWLGAPLEDRSGRPRVLFCGEAVVPKHFSTVHGAAASGRAQAERLLPKHKL